MDRRFFERVMFTDESIFTSKRMINKQNTRRWTRNNEHWEFEIEPDERFKTMVWCGIINNRLVGPHFFHENLNGERYLEFLQEDLPQYLQQAGVPEQVRQRMWFQQDGAPPHRAAIVRQYLNEIFPNRWIGIGGPMYWPPKSPDLAPPDFYLWGKLKEAVYATEPESLEELEEAIRNACAAIPVRDLQRCHETFIQKRVNLCIDVAGGRFEHFIRCRQCNIYINN